MKALHILPALFLIAGCAAGSTTGERVADRPQQSEAASFDADAMVRVADNLRTAGDHMSALRLYASARQRDPENLPALLGEAESLLALGIAGEAERRYATARALGGGARAEAGIARALMQQGRAEEALPHFAAALEAGAATAQIHNHYGVALDLLSRHGEAQVQYGRGLDLAPNDRGLINNLALSFALDGDFDAAVRLLSGLVTEAPDAADARSNLALVYGLSGDLTAAEGLIALGEKTNLRDAGTGRQQLAFIRQVAALPKELRPRAIILGLAAAMPRLGEATSPVRAESVPEEAPVNEPADELGSAPSGVEEAQSPPRDSVAPPVAEQPEAAAREAVAHEIPGATLERAAPSTDAAAPAAPHGVQLGAYPSRAVAEKNWPKIRERAPALLAGHLPHVWERGDIVRLVIPVEGAAAAVRLCAELGDAGVECLARPFDPAEASPLANAAPHP